MANSFSRLGGIVSISWAWKVFWLTLVVPVLLFLIFFHATIIGMLSSFKPWEEDGFKGRELKELEAFLAKRRSGLIMAEPRSFQRRFKRRGELPKNQEVFKFSKGEDYPWFVIGTVSNVGYVLVENQGDRKVIIKVYHDREVDSL